MLTEEQLNGFERKLTLDKNGLDIAAEEQPDLFYRVSLSHAEAMDSSESAKNELNAADARAALNIRRDLEIQGVKVTEGLVADRVVNSEEHKKAQSDFQKMQFQARRLGSIKEAFDQRAKMLRVLADLYMSNYFTTGAVQSTTPVLAAVDAKAGRDAMKTRRKIVRRTEGEQ